LGEAIGPNRFLTTIILDFNKIGAAGVEALSVGLSLNPKLAVVSLNNCDIGSEAGEVLGNTMAHAMWQELHLNNNKLGATGVAALSRGLSTNTSLKLLSLQVSSAYVTFAAR
jgi:Ran GTPase-activating protein (RanGAP) involved in mRNA processing and transport